MSATSQRATLVVPTALSHVSLGAPYTPPGGTRTQPGFSVSTTRNVFFRAGVSATFQATGQVWFQSEQAGLYAVATGGASMVATNALYLGGGGYVALMAGFGAVGAPADLRNSGDDDPGRPSAVDSVATATLAASLVCDITDKLVSFASVAKAIERLVRLNWHKPRSASVTAAVAGVVAQSGAAVGGLALYIEAKAAGEPSKTLNLYSQAGILAGTPAFCSIYGGLGVNYRSLNTTLLGNVAVAVSSGLASTLDSLFGQTGVSSGTSLAVESWFGGYLYCTQGPLSVYGKDIVLGGCAPDGGQLQTASMAISAVQKVALTSTSPLGGKVSLKAAKLAVKAPTRVAYGSTGITSIEVAPWEIIANGAEIVIKGAAGPVLKLSAAGVEIGPAAGMLKVAPGFVDVGGVLKVTPSAITGTAAHTELL